MQEVQAQEPRSRADEIIDGYIDLIKQSVGPIGTRLVRASRELLYSVIASQYSSFLSDINVPFSAFNAMYYALAEALRMGIQKTRKQCVENNNGAANYYFAGLVYCFLASGVGAGSMTLIGYLFSLTGNALLLNQLLSGVLFFELVSMHHRQVMLGLDHEVTLIPQRMMLDGSHVSFFTASFGVMTSILSALAIIRYGVDKFAYTSFMGLTVKGGFDTWFLYSSGKIFQRPDFSSVIRDLGNILVGGVAPFLQVLSELSVYSFALPYKAIKLGARYASVLQATAALEAFSSSVNAVSTGTTRQIANEHKKENPDLDQLRFIGNQGVILTSILSVFFYLIYWRSPRALMGIFTSDTETLDLAETIMPLICLGQTIYSIRFAKENVLRQSYQDTLPALMLSLPVTALVLGVCFFVKKSLSFDSAVFAGCMTLNFAGIAIRYLLRTNNKVASNSFWRPVPSALPALLTAEEQPVSERPARFFASSSSCNIL